MRENLSKFLGKRRVFQGTFKRFGVKSGWKGPLQTMLLVDVIDVKTKEPVADHLWFTCGIRFDLLKLEENDIVRFVARVTEYLKGYQGFNDYNEEGYQELDFRLSYPSKVEKTQPIVL